jgi:uncharacterized protein YndB with AHSA1/START domain
MMPSTIRLHRVLRATPERVYRAFLDPDAMVKWVPPNGFTGKVHHLDARVGGSYKMSFTNFTTGKSHLSFPKTQTCYNVCRFLFACVSPSHAVVVPQWA